ncbi:MAG: SRPBCC family protein [Anaeromyxobacter sp.]
MADRHSQEIVIAAPLEHVFQVIVDYARYPEFVPGIKACRVIREGPERQVQYDLDLGIKRITYVLRHQEERPHRVTWSLVSGDMMKVSNGSWDLAAEGNATRARYAVEIQVTKPPLVPQSLIDRVSDEMTRVSLPRNLQAFKARAEKKRA